MCCKNKNGFSIFQKYSLVLVQVVRDETEHDAVGDEKKENREKEKDELGDVAIEMAGPVFR